MNKEILTARVRKYTEREARLSSNMNNIYDIIWGQCTQGLHSVLKGNEDYNTKPKKSDLLWLMKEANKITAGIEVKLNNSATLHHTIRGFVKTKKGASESNDNFRINFDNIYKNMDIAGR